MIQAIDATTSLNKAPLLRKIITQNGYSSFRVSKKLLAELRKEATMLSENWEVVVVDFGQKPNIYSSHKALRELRKKGNNALYFHTNLIAADDGELSRARVHAERSRGKYTRVIFFTAFDSFELSGVQNKPPAFDFC